jgi:antitoxin YefM
MTLSMISEEDWSAILETLYLLSIPGMKKSIIRRLNTPIEDMEEYLDW